MKTSTYEVGSEVEVIDDGGTRWRGVVVGYKDNLTCVRDAQYEVYDCDPDTVSDPETDTVTRELRLYRSLHDVVSEAIENGHLGPYTMQSYVYDDIVRRLQQIAGVQSCADSTDYPPYYRHQDDTAIQTLLCDRMLAALSEDMAPQTRDLLEKNIHKFLSDKIMVYWTIEDVEDAAIHMDLYSSFESKASRRRVLNLMHMTYEAERGLTFESLDEAVNRIYNGIDE